MSENRPAGSEGATSLALWSQVSSNDPVTLSLSELWGSGCRLGGLWTQELGSPRACAEPPPRACAEGVRQ